MPLLGIGLLELIPFIVGLAALLIGLAGWIFANPIAHAFQKVPVIGGSIAGVVSRGIAGAVKNVWKNLEPMGKGPATFLLMLALSPWLLIWHMVNTVREAKHRANQALNEVATVQNQLRAQEIADVLMLEQSDFDNLVTAENYAYNLYTIEERQIASLQNQVNGLSASGIGGVSQTYVDGRISDLQAQLNADATQINTLTQDNLGFQTQLNTDVSTINATITRDVTDLTNEINANAQAVPGIALGLITGATPGIINQAVLQLAPQLQQIETEITTCLEPLCEPITPNAKQLGDLGKLLKDLEGLAAAGTLMGLLVAAVEDPKGTANAIVDVTGWIPQLGLDLTDAVASAAGVVL